MIYSHWGKRMDTPKVSRLGFGTTRFNPNDLKSKEGFKKSVALVEYALEKGINYFDVSPTYSYGYAEKILGEAFRNTSLPLYVAGKSGLTIDQTSDDILKRIDTSLSLLHVNHIEFYHIWSVMNMQQYYKIMEAGGLYEGIVKAKDRGLIHHLCISLHCDISEILKIVKDGAFEGITISMNAMNYEKWLPVLHMAKEKNIAIVTMNSLGGGIIPKYKKLFKTLDESNDSVPIKALRFLTSFSEIDVALSGMSTKEQIDENCKAFEQELVNKENDVQVFKIKTSEKLCSGCSYCMPCTVKIPIVACMQAYNHKIMEESNDSCIDEKQVINEMFIYARANGVNFIDLKKCIFCHKCEQRCTQKLNISERMEIMFKKAEKYGYTRNAILERLNFLEAECKEAKKIAIWPAANYAIRLLDFWNNPDFESRCIYFDSSEAMWGKEFRGKKIYRPEQLIEENIDTIVIVHYRLQEEIYEDIKKLTSKFPKKFKIVKLHNNNTINWFERG